MKDQNICTCGSFKQEKMTFLQKLKLFFTPARKERNFVCMGHVVRTNYHGVITEHDAAYYIERNLKTGKERGIAVISALGEKEFNLECFTKHRKVIFFE